MERVPSEEMTGFEPDRDEEAMRTPGPFGKGKQHHKWGGDFASGERTLPEDEEGEGPDFARGERTSPQEDERPDFARGERTLPAEEERPDFARGKRSAPREA